MMSQNIGNLVVDTGIRRIGVNEAGDYIELSLSDVTLFERYSGLMEWFDSSRADVGQFEKDFKARHAEDMESTQAFLEVAQKRISLFTECCRKIDEVFGAGCCRKVFGEMVPDELPIMDFFEQITPIIEKMAAERGEKLRTKFNRNRKGNVRQRTKEELIADFKADKAREGVKDGGTAL